MEEMFKQIAAGLVASGPVTGLLSYLWWSERDERRRLQKERDELRDKTLEAIGEATDAVRSVTTATQATRDTIEAMKDILKGVLSDRRGRY